MGSEARRRLGAPALLLGVCLLPAQAAADPITVTGGMYIHYPGDDAPEQQLTSGFLLYAPFADGFSALSLQLADHGGRVVVGPDRTVTPKAGAPWDLSNRVTWTSARLTQYTACNEEDCYDGVAYQISGTFVMTAGPALLEAPFADQPGLLKAYAPFTFTGFFEAFLPGSETLVFAHQIEGSGEAEFFTFLSRPGFFFYGYNFEATLSDVEPVPEPATMLLLVGGLGSLAIRLRRRAREGGGE